MIDAIREKSPLVHCITNHVTANDCANALLAIGARPIMAEHPSEAAEISARADALALNLGGITEEKMRAMRNAAASAAGHGIKITLDLVGVAASSVRREFAKELLSTVKADIIKGNASEIMALCGISDEKCGVDNNAALIDFESVKELSHQTQSVVLVSGKTDLIVYNEKSAQVSNGCEMMKYVTGTGCMLNALCGAFLACCGDNFKAAVSAAAAMGIAGELADVRGSGSFHISLIDGLYNLNDDIIRARAAVEYGI